MTLNEQNLQLETSLLEKCSQLVIHNKIDSSHQADVCTKKNFVL